METKGEKTCSRWKPTKRQTEILEELFKQGHCNPSRSRINEFTNVLEQHGNIEAKNVFYWFQNTHARNKRKQRRETHQMQQSPIDSTPQRQNTQPRNKRKQKKGTRQMQMQQSPTESTPQLHNEKDIVKSLEGQTYSSPTKAEGIIFDSSTIMAQFPVQGHTNSPDSTSSTATQKLLPMDLSVKQHFQSVRNESFSKVDGFRNNMWNKAAVRNDGWAHHFTDSSRNNVMTNCWGGEEHEKKDEILELFPLHPDGNLRSECISSSLHVHKETNDIRGERGEWLSLKFVP